MKESVFLGSFFLYGVCKYIKSFGKAHLFDVDGVEFTYFGTAGEYVKDQCNGKVCRVHGDIEKREYQGKVYPQFVARSCWSVRD